MTKSFHMDNEPFSIFSGEINSMANKLGLKITYKKVFYGPQTTKTRIDFHGGSKTAEVENQFFRILNRLNEYKHDSFRDIVVKEGI